MLTKQKLLAALNFQIWFVVIIFTLAVPNMLKRAFTQMTFYTVSSVPSICHLKPSNLTLPCLHSQGKNCANTVLMTHFTERM